MNLWPTMQKLLSPDDAGKSAPAPNAGRTAAALKPLPDDALIIIPLRNAVLFPGIMSPVTVGRPSSVAAAQEAARSERRAGFLLQRDPEKNELKPDDLHWVGTAGQVVRYITGAEGAHHLVVQGQSRFRALEFLDGWPFLVARVARYSRSRFPNSDVFGPRPDAELRLITCTGSFNFLTRQYSDNLVVYATLA